MNCYCILPHRSRPSLLLKSSNGRWPLPFIQLEEGTQLVYQTEQVRKSVQQKIGCDAVVLRPLATDEDKLCLELDLQQDFQINPLVYRWQDSDRLETLTFDLPEVASLVEQWLEESNNEHVQYDLAPFEQKGWFQAAEKWIQEQIAARNWQQTGAVLQVKCARNSSCLLYVGTSAGDLYFKASKNTTQSESRVTEDLSRQFPGEMPEIVAHDHEQDWMLIRDFGQNNLGTASNDHLPPAMKRMAEIQAETAQNPDTWTAMGCKCWDESWLVEQLIQLPAYLERVQRNYGFISPISVDRLVTNLPAIRLQIEKLFASSIPLTLVHTDFRAGHIIVKESGYLYFDWHGSVLTNPYFLLFNLLLFNDINKPFSEKELAEDLSGNPLWNATCDAFMEPFLGFESRQRQLELMSNARELFWLFTCLSYKHSFSQNDSNNMRTEKYLGFYAEVIRRSLRLANTTGRDIAE